MLGKGTMQLTGVVVYLQATLQVQLAKPGQWTDTERAAEGSQILHCTTYTLEQKCHYTTLTQLNVRQCHTIFPEFCKFIKNCF